MSQPLWRGSRSSSASDQIVVAGLRAFGHHGVLDHERRIGQDFVVDAVLLLDTRAAAAGDDLSLTVDYSQVANVIAAIVTGEPVKLLETLAGTIATACLAVSPLVREVEITVHKQHAPMNLAFSDVAIQIRRSRR